MELSRNEAVKHVQAQHGQADGYITLATKSNYGFKQYHYKAEELEEQLSKWLGEDVYFSQNTFYKPQRKIENIRQLRSLYADVDCYLLNYDPDWVVGKIEIELIQEKLPNPNLIIYSGRGIALVWLIEPVPYKALPLWQALQDHFLQQLKEVGGDPQAKDAARVFRIAGSINSKSGEVVKVQYRHNYRYALRDLQYEYLPKLQSNKLKRGRPSKIQRIFNIYSLYHARLIDLIKLVELRNYDVAGHRETICFLYRYWLCCYSNDPQEALRNTVELNLDFKEPLPLGEVEKATRSAEKAYMAQNDDEANSIAIKNGYPGAGYNISNKKIIEWLDITSKEMRSLSTIIDKEEKRRRNTEHQRKKRRNEGVLERSEYNKSRKSKKAENVALLKDLIQSHPNASNYKLAELMGLSEGYIRKLKKEIK